MARIAVIGGGYAGLAALVTLRERFPDGELTLLDPRPYHIIRTRLHERIRHPDARCRLDFSVIARRIRCRHIAFAPPITAERLLEADRCAELAWDRERIRFDCLVVATGSRIPDPPAGDHILTPDDLAELSWEEEARTRLDQCDGMPWITVIGSGPSGVQILFELDVWRRQWRRRHGRRIGLRLVSGDAEVLSACPPPMRRYAQEKMERAGIAFHPGTLARQVRPGGIVLEVKATGEERMLPSALCWACVGLRPWPLPFETDRYGRVRLGERVLTRIFAAGDCARFDGEGSNALSAQVAIRKGKHVARNIWRRIRGWPMIPYAYREQGYFVSMGPGDGAGWMGSRSNVLTGLPAFLIKEMLETGYHLSIL